VRSAVKWAVLGLLIEKPSYGYEIAQRFDRRFGEFIRASTSNIYATLDRLEREQLIEPLSAQESLETSKRQPKVSYRATGKGASGYRGWLAERLQENPERTGLLSRLATTGLLGAEAMLDVIDRYEEQCLQAARRAGVPGPGPTALTDGEEDVPQNGQSSELMQRLIAEEQRLAIEAQLRWIVYARSEIRSLAANADGRR
jgi:DNA-binding PadR family transcriptional regulator